MNTIKAGGLSPECDGLIIPFVKGGKPSERLMEQVGKPVAEAVETTWKAGGFKGDCGEVYTMNICQEERMLFVVFVGLGKKGKSTGREIFLAFGKALRLCVSSRVKKAAVLFDHAGEITWEQAVCKKMCELPYLVSYRFTVYKTSAEQPSLEVVEFVTEMEGFEKICREAAVCGESALLARDLINHPSMFMDSVRLCEEAVKVGDECGIEVKVFKKQEIEAMGMESFLAVARGAKDKPRLIVMRYNGGKPVDKPIALIGKGILFDSGGYNIKSHMLTMHGDMGGAAAVIGAMRAIALQRLKINVVAVVAACKNMISGDAYVPGDVLNSMNGKTIEMVNADAEGRLTLADAITYAIRKEGAKAIIDIATLTGAAKGAVGLRTAPVISNDDALFQVLWDASLVSCEKIWRLNADKELMPALESNVADIKNTDPGSPLGGGSIVAGLFIQEFVEENPWAHIDMAPVNWLDKETPYSGKGGAGYGVSLLYEAVKLLAEA